MTNFINKDNKIIKLAACPTCYELSKNLDKNKYQVIPTDSTAQSLALLAQGKVDMILAGRTLKPQEKVLDNLVISEGYSFLSRAGGLVNVDDLDNYNFFTDLDVDMLKTVFDIKEIVYVDNVYNYLDKGIIITSWDNTNYLEANIVHVLDKNGARMSGSRQPTLYCGDVCDKTAQKLVEVLEN